VYAPVEVAIVGAGPYGLSLAAHLNAAGIQTRVFGRPMDSWRSHMPEGMLLKSDPFASSLSDPQDFFTLARFSEEQAIPYSESKPVRLDVFCNYGLAFQKRCVPRLADVQVTTRYAARRLTCALVRSQRAAKSIAGATLERHAGTPV
jgi:cation diffusion facilitator CzcD-associated flavoprotein CzcO